MVKIIGKPLSTNRIRAIEENAVYLGLPLRLLMESAGKCVADETDRIRRSRNLGKKVFIIAGKGGNAGDGFVASRYLINYGYEVTIGLLYHPLLIQNPVARDNFELISKINGIKLIYPWSDDFIEIMSEHDIIIDAILGTGVRGELKDPVGKAIKAINSSGKTIISIDVPSGLDPDTGLQAYYKGESLSIIADYTIIMHYQKKGLINNNQMTGEQFFCNIGIPPEAEEIVGPGDVRHMLRKKSLEAKKGDGGRLLIIGGSIDFTGAPVLAGMAAVKSGTDLVYLVVPKKIRKIVATYSPELITKGVGEKDYFNKNDAEKILSMVDKMTAIILGPGLAYNEDTCEFTLSFLDKLKAKAMKKPLVIDADAIKCIAENRVTLWQNIVITPHRGELHVLADRYGIEKYSDRKQLTMELSKRLDVVVLSKGPIDYICYKDNCRINKSGNPGMSVGGTGDILAGLVGSFINRTENLLTAASIAAYINGLAADEVCLEKNEFISPMDIIERIPKILGKYFNQ